MPLISTTLFMKMLNGLAYCEVCMDEDGKPYDFKYLEVNPAFEKITGIKRDDILNKKAAEVFSNIETKHPQLYDYYFKTTNTGNTCEFEIFFEPINKWLHIIAYSTEPNHFVSVFEDITLKKMPENRYKIIFEAIADSIIIIDITSGNIIDANPASSKLFMLPLNKLIGIHHTQMYPKDLREIREKRFKEYTKTTKFDKKMIIKSNILTSENLEIPVEISAQIINYDNKKAIMSIFRNI